MKAFFTFLVFTTVLNIYSFSQDFSWFSNDYGKYGFKNAEGKVVVEPFYDNYQRFKNGYASVNLGVKYHQEGYLLESGKWGFIDTTGKLVIQLKYDDVSKTLVDGIAFFKLNDKWGFVNQNGIEIISPMYQDANYFIKGLARVKLNDKWGFIDVAGTVKIDFIFESATDFKDGKSEVKLNGESFWIDILGNNLSSILKLSSDRLEIMSYEKGL